MEFSPICSRQSLKISSGYGRYRLEVPRPVIGREAYAPGCRRIEVMNTFIFGNESVYLEFFTINYPAVILHNNGVHHAA